MSLLSDGNPIGWVEIPTSDLERARAFYGAIFDIDVQELDLGDLRFGFLPMQQGAAGSAAALVHHAAMYQPSGDGVLVYFEVRDIEAVLERVAASGGSIFQHRKSVGDFGYVGFFEDSEGNRIGLHARS